MDFDKIANDWDSERRIKRAEAIADEIFSKIKNLNTKKLKALEFGCGTGLVSLQLKDKFKTIDLFDTSSGMLEVLRANIKDFDAENMNVLAENIPIENKYDVIYSSMVMHHIVDVERTIENLFGFLEPNGYLCIVDLVEEDGNFHKAEEDFVGHNGFNLDSFGDLLRKVGLKEVTCQVFYSGEKQRMEEKVKYSLFIGIGKK